MQPEVPQTASFRDEPHVSEALKAAQKPEIPKLDTIAALWLILFVFGGGLLALYYAGINYFPQVSWQDALTSMALMTIIGGSLLVAYCFLLFVPGAIWSEFLICDKQLHEVLTMDAWPAEPCVWSVTKRILFPFALFMAFCHLLLYLQDKDGSSGFVVLGAAASLAAVSCLLGRDLREGLECIAMTKSGSQRTPAGAHENTSTLIWPHRLHLVVSHAPLLVAFFAEVRGFRLDRGVLWVFALLPVASFVGLLVAGRVERHAPGKGLVPDEWSILCRSILSFCSAALLSLAALWFFSRIYKGGIPGTSDKAPWSLLLLCTLVVIVTNLAVSVLFGENRRAALLTSFLAALLLLGAGQLLGTKPQEQLPAKIMEKFGFGGESATLVLTEWGGRLLCQQGIHVKLEKRAQAGQTGSTDPQEQLHRGFEKPTDGKPREEGRLARAVGARILSRLGSEYLLRFDEQKVTLPKGEVVSWSTSPNAELKIEDKDDDCKQLQN